MMANLMIVNLVFKHCHFPDSSIFFISISSLVEYWGIVKCSFSSLLRRSRVRDMSAHKTTPPFITSHQGKSTIIITALWGRRDENLHVSIDL